MVEGEEFKEYANEHDYSHIDFIRSTLSVSIFSLPPLDLIIFTALQCTEERECRKRVKSNQPITIINDQSNNSLVSEHPASSSSSEC